jgi:hypothetical protein
MQRILALQTLPAVGAETIINDQDIDVMTSSCSYISCGNCSSASFTGCKPDPFMIVPV